MHWACWSRRQHAFEISAVEPIRGSPLDLLSSLLTNDLEPAAQSDASAAEVLEIEATALLKNFTLERFF
jgi:hypothetical protein